MVNLVANIDLSKFTTLTWGMFAERNKTEIVAVAYLDCLHQLVSIIFIVFIRNTNLPGASVY